MYYVAIRNPRTRRFELSWKEDKEPNKMDENQALKHLTNLISNGQSAILLMEVPLNVDVKVTLPKKVG